MSTPSHAWQLWYAAKKYMLDSLEEKCRKVRPALFLTRPTTTNAASVLL